MNKRTEFGLRMAKIGFLRKKYKKRSTGAAYVEGGTVIIGCNDQKTSPFAKQMKSTWHWNHAEFSVLKHVDDGSNGVLYLYREIANGDLAMSRPCDICEKLLREKNIRKVIYTINNGWVEEKYHYTPS